MGLATLRGSMMFHGGLHHQPEEGAANDQQARGDETCGAVPLKGVASPSSGKRNERRCLPRDHEENGDEFVQNLPEDTPRGADGNPEVPVGDEAEEEDRDNGRRRLVEREALRLGGGSHDPRLGTVADGLTPPADVQLSRHSQDDYAEGDVETSR